MKKIMAFKKCFLYVLSLMLWIFFMDNSMIKSVAYGEESNVRLNNCSDKEFKITTGSYTIQFNDNTKDMIIISHPMAWGVLGLNLMGNGREANLLNSTEAISSSKNENEVAIVIEGKKSWTDYKLTIYAFKNHPGLLRWLLQLVPRKNPPQITTKRELRQMAHLDRGLNPVKPEEIIIGNFPNHFHAQQIPFAAPLIYMSSLGWWYGSLCYFEDLTSLNEMFEITNTGAKSHMVDISLKNNSFGYKVPEEILNRLPFGKEVTVVDSYLYLSEQLPVDEPDLAWNFLHSLSIIYDFIKKPKTELTDWQHIAQREIADLNHPSLWVNIDGKPYLRAYVADKRTSAELISQLDVLLALKKYQLKYDGVETLVHKLVETLPDFYFNKFKLITNDLPHKEKGDSWYFVEEMIQLAKLAKLGESTARDLLFNSVESMITLHHTFSQRDS